MKNTLSRIFRVFALSTLLLTVLPRAQAGEPLLAVRVHHEFNFLVSSYPLSGGEIYYNPRSVESFARGFLRQLGAQNIFVQARGIGSDLVLNPRVWVRFDSIHLPGDGVIGAPVTAEWRSIRMSGFDNGHLARQLMINLGPSFEIRDFQGNTRLGRDGAYRFSLTTLFTE